jgi:hypothetical protein
VCGAQCIRTIRKEMDDREPTAERHEIPRAIHIGHRLEQADNADAEDGCYDEIGRCATDSTPTFDPKRRKPYHDRSRDDGADRPSPTGVNEHFDPEVTGADPLGVLGVEEQRVRDRSIYLGKCEEDSERQEERYLPAHFAPPKPARKAGHQNDFFVSIRNCIESMSFVRLSGNARSICRMFPSPDRALPSRSPIPMSVSQPSGDAA